MFHVLRLYYPNTYPISPIWLHCWSIAPLPIDRSILYNKSYYRNKVVWGMKCSWFILYSIDLVWIRISKALTKKVTLHRNTEYRIYRTQTYGQTRDMKSALQHSPEHLAAALLVVAVKIEQIGPCYWAYGANCTQIVLRETFFNIYS